MRKIKKITKIEELEDAMPQDDDEVSFFVQYDDSMQQIMLSIMTRKPMTPEAYMLALQSFVNDASEFPQTLFVEDIGDVESVH